MFLWTPLRGIRNLGRRRRKACPGSAEQLWGRTLLRLEQPRGKAGLPSGSISRGRPVRAGLGPGAWANVATGQLLFATCLLTPALSPQQ